MAASDSNAVAAQTANPFGSDHHPPVSCLDDPNFATICSFIQNFGEIVRIGQLPFDELQQWLENTSDVPPPLVQLHITLLRRVFKTVSLDKWERSLAKFGHTYCSQDAWEVERFGYKKAKIQTKLRLLKNLLEAQFDYNVKFKAEVNKLQAADLRLTPLGRDTEGQLYWYQVDADANLRVYREDIDDETWEIVASDRDELENLISQLQRGEVKKPEPEEAIIVPEEDSNSKDDIEPSKIILDTGKVEEDDDSGESEDEVETNKETRTVQPLILKHAFNIDKAHCKEVEKVDSDVVDKAGSNTESEPKVPKLVLGLKPKTKVENDLPNKIEPQVDIAPPSEHVAIPVPVPDIVMEDDSNAVHLPMPKSVDIPPPPPPQIISELKTEPIEEPAQQDAIQVVKKVEKRDATLITEQPETKDQSKPTITADPKPAKVSRLHDVSSEIPASSGPKEQTHAKSSRNITKSQKDVLQPDKKVDNSSSVTVIAKDPANKTTEQPKPIADPKPAKISRLNNVISEIPASAGSKEQAHAKPSRNITKSQEDVLQVEKKIESSSAPISAKDPKIKITEPSKPVADPKPANVSSISSDVINVISASVKQREQSHAKSSKDITTVPQVDKKVVSGDVTVKAPETKITEPSKPITDPKPPKVSRLNDVISEISASVEQREQSHAKSSKNIKKSSKINSIAERLNRNLPEASAKSVDDCLNLSSSEKVDSRSSVPAVVNQGLDLSFTKNITTKSSTKESMEIKSILDSARDHGINLTITPLTATPPQKISTPEKESKSLAKVLESLQTKDNTLQISEEAKKKSEAKAALTMEQPGKKKDSVEFKPSSITREPKFSNSPLSKNEDTMADKLADSASSSAILRDSNIISKDNGTAVPEPQDVPINVQESDILKPTLLPVEETVQKTKTWVCGDTKSQPVSEKVVVKEKAWVCGNESQPVAEKVVVKESAWVCGDKNKETVSNILETSNNQSRLENSLRISRNKPDTQVVAPEPQVGKLNKGATPNLQNFSAGSHSSLGAPKESVSLPVNIQSDIEAPASVQINQETKSVPYGLSENPQSKVEKESLSIISEKRTAGTECIENVGQSAVPPTSLVNEDSNSKSVVSLDPIPSISKEESERKVKPIVVEKSNTEDKTTIKNIETKSSTEGSMEIKSILDAARDQGINLTITPLTATPPQKIKTPEKELKSIAKVMESVEIRPEDKSKDESTTQSKITPPSEHPPAPSVIEAKSDVENKAVTTESHQTDPVPKPTKEIKPVAKDESSDLPSEKSIEETVKLAVCTPPLEPSEQSTEIYSKASAVASVVGPPEKENALEVKSAKVSLSFGEIKPIANEVPLTKSQAGECVEAASVNATKPEDTKTKDSTGSDTLKLKEKVVSESKVVSENLPSKPSETQSDKNEAEEPRPIPATSNDISDTISSSIPVKSSLVSALYSESSESSNEAFPTASISSEKVNTPRDSATDKLTPSTTETKSSGMISFSTEIRKQDSDKKSNPVSSNLESKEETKNDTPTSGPSHDPLKETGESKENSVQSIGISNSVAETTSSLHPDNFNGNSLVPIDPQSKESASTKRKADEEIESLSKIPKIDEVPIASQKETSLAVSQAVATGNPIVGEAVEEEVMTISGEGSGAMNEGGNEREVVPFNPICGETIEEEIMTIIGEGFGVMNQGSNENSPVSLAIQDMPGSQDESNESDASREAIRSSRGRGGRRGRGRGRGRGRPPGTPNEGRKSQGTPSSTPRSNNRGSREVARLGVSIDSVELNGENERPVRASRRIAQIRQKEEEERRQLEEERLAQLKAAQMRKKAKQDENKGDNVQSPCLKVKKGKGRKSQKDEVQYVQDYVPSGSESAENSDDEGEGSDDQYSGKVGKGKRRKRRKNGKAKKGGNPWATSSDDDEEEQVEEEEEYHYEEEEEELVFKSDHEFSPESDVEEGEDVVPSRHARTAKQDKGDLFEEGNCNRCRKGDHPEWILLCDKCDKGWHASCLRPQLWVIPEGEWFCPPCQHNMLIENLSKNLVEYEGLLKRKENEILRKQRLAYVGISLDNVLPDKEPEPEIPEQDAELYEKIERDRDREKRRTRRRILSDEELSDDFINDGDSNDVSRSRSGSSGSDSEDGPVYRLRQRRTKKAFDFKEYDDMINSALRVDDDEEDVAEAGGGKDMGPDEEEDENEEQQLNGDEKESPEDLGGGKNEAYFKHLEKQAQEEDETDEELLDEKERLRRKELKKQGQRKTKRRINDLDAYSEDEDSDDDFKASEEEDDEEALAEEGESEWSGDKMEDDSDDSIAKRARTKDRHGRRGRLGRKEKYSDKGLVRRSTRKRRARISYDESDEDEEEEDQADKWQSDEESEAEESESNSESDDSTYGKKKKKGGFAAAKPKMPDFGLGATSTKGKGKGGVKRKKRRIDDDDVDKAWNSARGKKEKDEPIERRTRGRKINFKDILDSGESDDDGNVRPKRRPLSDSDDSRSPSSSRKLAEEIRAENARKEKEYEEMKAKMGVEGAVTPTHTQSDIPDETKEVAKIITIPTAPMSESHTIARLSESSVKKTPAAAPLPKISPPLAAIPLTVHPKVSAVSPPAIPSPANLSAVLSPSSIPIPASVASMVMPVITSPPVIPPNSSPLLHSTLSASILPATLMSVSTSAKQSSPIPSMLPKSPPPIPFIPKSTPPMIPVGSPHKSNSPVVPPPPVPVPLLIEKKSSKKGSRVSRGSKSEQPIIASPPPSDLEIALTKPVKNSPHGSTSSSKSSSKKRDRDRERESTLTVPNPSLLMAGVGGVLPELLGAGLAASVRPGLQGLPILPTGSSSTKRGKSSGSSSSRTTQQTTPPPVPQNLNPSLPIDIDRVPNPALFQGNPGLRSPFHPMWGVKNSGPPAGYSPPGSQIPTSLGKPPPLNTSPFGQQGPPSRPGFPSPPPLRIPNPNTSPLQAFQHFKRDSGLGGPMYRLPPGQPQPGVPLPNILPPGMMSPHSGGPERFFGAPPGYPHPYGLLPPHSQGPPQALFPYDYRPPEPPFKEEPVPPPPRTTSSSIPTPVSSSSSSPPPTTSAPVSLPAKDEGASEFGGLVSYFSSQRSEEDMDT